MEVISRTKVSFDSIKTLTGGSKDRFGDEGYRELFFQTLLQTIEKTDAFINGLIDYLKVSTPLVKRNTVATVIEGVLKKHRTVLEEKKARLLKQFEKDLPETILPEVHLNYILDSVIQYVVDSISPNDNLGIVTRSLGRPDQGSKRAFEKDGPLIEILVFFPRPRKTLEQPWVQIGVPVGKGEAMNLALGLVREMVHRHRGTMTIETGEGKEKTIISFRLPVERRKIVRYPDG
jgi:nitrogen-specific signal transduction histidine kinase